MSLGGLSTSTESLSFELTTREVSSEDEASIGREQLKIKANRYVPYIPIRFSEQITRYTGSDWIYTLLK